MEPRNTSTVTEFHLLGFQNLSALQALLFPVFLLTYLLTVTGNLTIIVIVSQNPRLNTPMYTFLKHLSLLEIWYTTTIAPMLLTSLLSWRRAISFPACMTQLYFFVFFGATECFLLTTMAYDRYLAICNPLYYTALMSPGACMKLVVGSWMAGLWTALVPSLMISKLRFCGPNQIDHFFCDLLPLMQLSCSSTAATETVIFILSVMVLCICFLMTLFSYVFIVSTILKIPSASGQRKTFSTCGSHLAVVTIYYGTMISMYVRPNALLSPDLNKVISVFYTVVTPLLNPIVYSLRNRDFKEILRKVVKRNSSI
ncbi:olfactory receptor 11L1-like [Ornithorhynchus anatinus]|uniref:olfactory receptor 11L1-like n=1 Tax=Ornithorhynchus anatinus TaxID=9258 RepID=UPI0010A90EC7|nr:olfactory receptor 11L1-like [Ornithorhynchus anatinus]